MNKTRRINVGGVFIGGGAPVAVQTMLKKPVEDVRAAAVMIKKLERAGCEIIRVAVPHPRALAAIEPLKGKIAIPMVADIHFSVALALGALEAGADCVRVNPGNIGDKKELEKVARAATKLGRAIRIGVNSGSLEKDLAANKNLEYHEKLVESALRGVETAEKCGLKDIKVSLKSFDVPATVAAYRKFSTMSDVPLHIGITEAGDDFSGAIRSAAGLGILLSEGIGDTIRVSLTAKPEREIEAAWEILRALELRRRGVEIVSCPTCGRTVGDVEKIAAEIKKKTRHITAPLRIAVMGCEVNGPGEAAAADLGVALNRTGGGVLFAKGLKIRKVRRGEAVDAVIGMLSEIENKA